jgi:hypothetical protein
VGGAERNARGRQASVVRVSAGGYSPGSAVAQPFAVGRRILAGTVLGARARVGLCACAIVSQIHRCTQRVLELLDKAKSIRPTRLVQLLQLTCKVKGLLGITLINDAGAEPRDKGYEEDDMVGNEAGGVSTLEVNCIHLIMLG